MIDYQKIIENQEITPTLKECFEYMQSHEINIFVLPIIQKIECQIRNNKTNRQMISDLDIEVLKKQKYFITVEVYFKDFFKIINYETYDNNTEEGNNLKWSIESVLEKNGIDNSTELKVVAFVLSKIVNKDNRESKALNYELHSLFNQLCNQHCISPLSSEKVCDENICLTYDLSLLEPSEREIVFEELFSQK